LLCHQFKAFSAPQSRHGLLEIFLDRENRRFEKRELGESVRELSVQALRDHRDCWQVRQVVDCASKSDATRFRTRRCPVRCESGVVAALCHHSPQHERPMAA
jgi:hypothetical protein